MDINKITFQGSFPSESSCPSSELPEYAFIGRSNVGKSSLINMLCNRKELARTSKKPGKTRLINLFLVDKTWYLADLPGYGFAQVSKSERKAWEKMIEKYMLFRPNLVCAFLLIDLRHELQEIDRNFMNWLGERRVPFVVIFTKSDKIKPASLQNHIDRILNQITQDWDPTPDWIMSSAINRAGQDKILNFIEDQNLKIAALKKAR